MSFSVWSSLHWNAYQGNSDLSVCAAVVAVVCLVCYVHKFSEKFISRPLIYITAQYYTSAYTSTLSSWTWLTCVFPQGLVLGSILFILYTADLVGLVEQHLYTNGTQVYCLQLVTSKCATAHYCHHLPTLSTHWNQSKISEFALTPTLACDATFRNLLPAASPFCASCAAFDVQCRHLSTRRLSSLLFCPD